MDGEVQDVLIVVNSAIQDIFLKLMVECIHLIKIILMHHHQTTVCNQQQLYKVLFQIKEVHGGMVEPAGVLEWMSLHMLLT